MVTFDFEQSGEKSILRLSGPLKKEDAGELKRILLNSLNGSSSLIVDVDNVTSISLPCKQIFSSINKKIVETGQRLVFTGKPGKEVSLSQW